MPSPKFDRSQVEHLAKLAALSLSDSEAEGFAKELAAIVAYVEELSHVDTSSVEHVTNERVTNEHETAPPSAWREDRVVQGLSHEDALAAAPRATDEGFAVPGFVSTGGGERERGQ